MLACHESQVFEWLPFNQGLLDKVPKDAAGRRAWLREWVTGFIRPRADRYRDSLVAKYGKQRGRCIEFCEVYEISEHAGALTDELRERLFGFV